MPKTEIGPRCPVGIEEAYAWGYMIGYLGQVPDLMREAFNGNMLDDDVPIDCWGSEGCPTFLENYDDECREFMRGYWAGVSMYSDHAHPEDRGDN